MVLSDERMSLLLRAIYDEDSLVELARSPEEALRDVDEAIAATHEPGLHLVKLYLLLLSGRPAAALAHFQSAFHEISSSLDVLREYLLLAYQLGCRSSCDAVLREVEGRVLGGGDPRLGLWLGETLVFIAYTLPPEERRRYAKWAVEVLEEARRRVPVQLKERADLLLRLARKMRRGDLVPSLGMAIRMVLFNEELARELEKRHGLGEPDPELARRIYLASRFYGEERCSTCPRPPGLRDACRRGLLPCIYEPVFELYVKLQGDVEPPDWALEKSRILTALRGRGE